MIQWHLTFYDVLQRSRGTGVSIILARDQLDKSSQVWVLLVTAFLKNQNHGSVFLKIIHLQVKGCYLDKILIEIIFAH